MVHSLAHFDYNEEVYVLASAEGGVEVFKLGEVKSGVITGGAG